MSNKRPNIARKQVWIPPEVWEDLEKLAVRQGTTRQDVIRRCLWAVTKPIREDSRPN